MSRDLLVGIRGCNRLAVIRPKISRSDAGGLGGELYPRRSRCKSLFIQRFPKRSFARHGLTGAAMAATISECLKKSGR
jgi:hypothetical protein